MYHYNNCQNGELKLNRKYLNILRCLIWIYIVLNYILYTYLYFKLMKMDYFIIIRECNEYYISIVLYYIILYYTEYFTFRLLDQDLYIIIWLVLLILCIRWRLLLMYLILLGLYTCSKHCGFIDLVRRNRSNPPYIRYIKDHGKAHLSVSSKIPGSGSRSWQRSMEN